MSGCGLVLRLRPLLLSLLLRLTHCTRPAWTQTLHVHHMVQDSVTGRNRQTRQTHRQTQTCRQTDTQAGRHRQAGRQTQTGRQADTEAGRHRQVGRQTQTDTQADRHTGRQAGRQTHRQAGRQTCRDLNLASMKDSSPSVLERVCHTWPCSLTNPWSVTSSSRWPWALHHHDITRINLLV